MHRLEAVRNLSQLLSRFGIPPCRERRILRRLFLRKRKGPADREARIWNGAVDARPRGKIREKGRVASQLRGIARERAFDLHERREEFQVLLRIGAPGDGLRDRTRERRDRRGLIAGAKDQFLSRLVHRHRSLDHRHHRATHAGGHREDRSLDRGDRIARQHPQISPALFGGFDDDVAALEVDGLAAPGGGDEEFRSFVDIHRRSVGEPQHRVAPRACADCVSFADGGTGFEGLSAFALRASADKAVKR